jgi:hypothetical protein
MTITASFEGPPTSDAMRDVVMDLLFDRRVAAAHQVAATMVDFWLERDTRKAFDLDDVVRSFNYWLGIKTTTGILLSGERCRAERRALKKARGR